MKEVLRKKYNETFKKYGVLGIILLIIAFLSIISGILISYKFFSITYESISLIEQGESIDPDLTGMVGDFIGGVIGTIWSFAGVILFFLALRLQSRELSLQIKELRDTREVFTTQQFENTFFNLLKTQNDIRQNIELREEISNPETYEKYTKTYKANSAFEEIRKHLYEQTSKLNSNIIRMERVISKDSKWDDEERKKKLDRFEEFYSLKFDEIKNGEMVKTKIIYKATYGKYHDQLGHYFRNLYHILLYIKENEDEEINLHYWEQNNGTKVEFLINNEDIIAKRIKRKYFKYSQFIQAQMSESELLLTFYNSLFFPKFKSLVKDYNLIENLNTNNFLYKDSNLEYYNSFDTSENGIGKKRKKSLNEIFDIKASI